MTRRHEVAVWAAALCAALLWGCGDDGASEDVVVNPSGEEVVHIQKADAAGAAVDDTVAAASEVLVDAGSGGAVSAKASAEGAAAPTPVFDFQKSVSLLVDLDAPDAQGNDRFPNATGVISVSAEGNLQGGGGAGHADYAVQVVYATDAVFTDPVSGGTVAVAAGASFSYSLAVDWAWTDAYNWTITHVSHAQVTGLVMTVTCGGGSATASVEAVRDVACTLTRAVGSFTATWSVTGAKTVTLSSGEETHTVAIEVKSLAEIYITVDGIVYGPYTAAQLRWICGIDVH